MPITELYEQPIIIIIIFIWLHRPEIFNRNVLQHPKRQKPFELVLAHLIVSVYIHRELQSPVWMHFLLMIFAELSNAAIKLTDCAVEGLGL